MSPIRRRLGRAVAATAVAACTALGLVACGADDGVAQDEGTTLEDINEEGTEDQGDLDQLPDDATEQDIAQAADDDSTAFFDDRESFLDQPVTVTGEIVEVLSPRAFVIGEGDQATLVTRPDGDGVTLLPGYLAQVTGQVGTFILADAEAELGVDLDDATFSVFQDGPYIAAADVNLLDAD